MRLVIWKDMGKLDVGNLEYDTEVGDSIRQGTENDMDFLDMCRSQIGCLNEKLQTFANVYCPLLCHKYSRLKYMQLQGSWH